MYEYKDLRRLTLIATTFLCGYAALDILSSAAQLVQGVGDGTEFRTTEVLMLVNFAFLLTCFFIVGRWIYRASVNAHALGSNMTISPDWAVGWYFIPFANLIKPFHAMREIWWASHESRGDYEERVPILALWWGLWITTNVASNIAMRYEPVAPAMTMIAAVLNVALCAVLINIMRDIGQSQEFTRNAETFA